MEMEDLKRQELKKIIIQMWKEAFLKGTDKAWKAYHRELNRLAKDVGASSPQALEDWALRKDTK